MAPGQLHVTSVLRRIPECQRTQVSNNESAVHHNPAVQAPRLSNNPNYLEVVRPPTIETQSICHCASVTNNSVVHRGQTKTSR